MDKSQDFVSILKSLSLIDIRDEELADKFMVSVSTVRRWESGKSVPGPFMRQEISKLLQKEPILNDCYHTGLAYSLAYEAGNDKIELAGETFTTLDTGINGGAMTALQKHREDFITERDVPYFIVALKPVEIILGRKDDEPYELPCSNAGCDSCGTHNLIDGEKVCGHCLDEEICDHCNEKLDNCSCEFDDNYECDDSYCDRYSTLNNEFDQEYIADSFHKMNAFSRAKWLKTQGKL